ncbi:MAG TPA: hypothetical protein VLI54_04350 [Bacillota bacterium]|nr:hypothetical protein [Bacillota bacterium]
MDNDGSGPLEGMDFQPTAAHQPNLGKRASGKKKWLLVSLIVLAVLILGGGTAALLLKKKPAPQASSSTQQTTANSSAQSSAGNGSSTPGTYKSTTLNLEFSYPTGWSVKESADKAEVIATSPTVSYTKKDGSAAQGVFTVKMRHGAIPDAIQQTTIKTIAVADSFIIAYDHPTTNQRQYTNVSYGGTDANTFNYFIVSGNTALKAGQTFGYGVDLTGADTYMFAGGYGADTADTLSFEAVSKTTYDSATLEQAVGIIKSLQIN